MIKHATILRVAVPVPLRFPLDYLLPDDFQGELKPGMRVRVPFQRREIIGIIVDITQQTTIPSKQLKQAIAILDAQPVLPSEIISLATFASQYYHHPIGEVFEAFLPALLRKGKPATIGRERRTKTQYDLIPGPILTEAQQHSVENILLSLHQFQTFLLHGVTGSGKTEVYFKVIAAVLNENRQALVLVPEIALTPQTVARFQERFGIPTAVLHSGLTDRERLNAWVKATSEDAKIIIGTRSAIFTPITRLGVIIIDEEHDSSYKQQDGFRYSARDLAILRARQANIPIVLGSATPSLESQYNVMQNRYQLLALPERAGLSKLPRFHVVDVRNQKLDQGLSTKMLQAIRMHITQGGQVLLFLNRRGFAPNLICHRCGWTARCHRCDANMILHQQPPGLHCHHCASMRAVASACPECKNRELVPLGLGTERIELALQKHFPEIGITRIDSDTLRKKGMMQEKLADITSGRSQILIGTQILAKGHHFPNVSMVAIIDADSGFFSADLRASERIGQLLVQVAGRAGRAEKPGEVWIQTRHPDHPLLIKLLVEGYIPFSQAILQERQQTLFPPYGYLALLRAEALDKDLPLGFLTQVRQLLSPASAPNIQLLGPIPSPMERRAGRYRAQLLIKTEHRSKLHPFLSELIKTIDKLKMTRQVRWALDVDPLDMF